MNMQGQVDKIEKHNETVVAMPTGRNLSPPNHHNHNDFNVVAAAKQSRNAFLPSAAASNASNSNQNNKDNAGTLRTLNIFNQDGEQDNQSPHMQSRLLQNFNQARQTLRKTTKKSLQPVPINPV